MMQRKRRVFFQFLITTIWLLVFDVPFILMSFLPVTPMYGFCVTMAYTINCSINGWVYFLLNRGIRKAILRLFTLPPTISIKVESNLPGPSFVPNAVIVASPAFRRRSSLDTTIAAQTQIVHCAPQSDFLVLPKYTESAAASMNRNISGSILRLEEPL